MVLHHVHGSGNGFKLLGTTFDVKLVMETAVAATVGKAVPKLTALVRTSACYDVLSMVQSLKTYILCLLEGSTSAVYHASPSVLAPLDHVQDRFLRIMGLDEAQAFLDYNLAPLRLRRDVAMLGLIFKCSHGLARPKLCELFPRGEAPVHTFNTRAAAARHPYQLLDRADGCRLTVVKRSSLGLVRVYNLLPQEFVECSNVSAFQSHLTRHVRTLCKHSNQHWAERFRPTAPHHVLMLR